MKIARKKLLLTLLPAVVITGAAIGGVMVLNPSHSGATDSPITTQLDNQQSELDNHEARITNTESDVSDLQGKTNTPPSSNHTDVPTSTNTSGTSAKANTSAPTEETTKPEAPTVTSTDRCKTTKTGTNSQTVTTWTIVHYSDGTTSKSSEVIVPAPDVPEC